ncbi:hypothetical protein [Bosea sp. TAF32]|uniref:hypothetical protein n=1 Tax=Bosea sp. TAF32 TaxID=3237482 RepID=UPI003F8DDF95
MAPIPYSFRAYVFNQTLRHMHAAYRAAAKALAHRSQEIEVYVRRELGLEPGDPFPDRDDDDDELDYIGRLYDEASDLEYEARNGAHLVRKAFLIALFHHWERHCNRELKRDSYAHPRQWLNQRGRSELAKEILELSRAANCAKHGPGHSCSDLFKTSPHLFPRVTPAIKPSENTLEIDEATLERFFTAVRKAAS